MSPLVETRPTTAVSPETATDHPKLAPVSGSEAVSWAQVPAERTNTGVGAGDRHSGAYDRLVAQEDSVAIYRLISESLVGGRGDDLVYPPGGSLVGPMSTGIEATAMDGLSMPCFDVPRARFWFTEAGWKRFGIAVVKDHEAAGLRVRVLRQKNPPDSAIVYRDPWQVALLPPNQRKS